MRNICVFLGSSGGNNPNFLKAAIALGKEIASREMTLVYGGADVGLMAALANAVIDAGGDVIGVMPKALAAKEITHQNLKELYIVKTMQQRKEMLVELSDGFIALPGGLGTLDEIFEIWSQLKVGLHKKPLGLLNIDGYYNKLFEFLNNAIDSGFMTRQQFHSVTSAKDCSSLIDLLLGEKALFI